MDNCPLEDRIPKWLITTGMIALIQGLFDIITRNNHEQWQSRRQRFYQFIGLVMNVFQIVLVIIGSVWVYMNYEPSYNENDRPLFCNQTVYLFSFWILNITYMGLCLILIISFVLFFYNKMCN